MIPIYVNSWLIKYLFRFWSNSSKRGGIFFLNIEKVMIKVPLYAAWSRDNNEFPTPFL